MVVGEETPHRGLHLKKMKASNNLEEKDSPAENQKLQDRLDIQVGQGLDQWNQTANLVQYHHPHWHQYIAEVLHTQGQGQVHHQVQKSLNLGLGQGHQGHLLMNLVEGNAGRERCQLK